jgi:hypothetical protein
MRRVLIKNMCIKVTEIELGVKILVHLGEMTIIDEFQVRQSQWEHPVFVSRTPACTYPYLAPFYKLMGWGTWNSNKHGLSVHQF